MFPSVLRTMCLVSEQTLGSQFASDGRLQGTESVQSLTCDTSSNTCMITVPAPGMALVSFTPTSDAAYPTHTYATSTMSATTTKATVDPSVIATSNGSKGGGAGMGSTSREKSQTSRATSQVAPSLFVFLGMLFGTALLGRAHTWR